MAPPSPKRCFREDIVNLASKAITHPRVPAQAVGPGNVHWDLSFTCEAPIRSERWAHARKGKHATLTLSMALRCRRCKPCLAARQAHWTARAISETEKAVRTWFATFTLSPDEQYKLLAETCVRLESASVTYGDLSPDQQFSELARTALDGKLRKVWKALRKVSKFTYLIVAERHKSGLPHFHALIHEMNPDAPLSWRTLAANWPFGHATFKLVEGERPARYVAKYLHKCSGGMRVRCSRRYGDQRERNTVSDHRAKPVGSRTSNQNPILGRN